MPEAKIDVLIREMQKLSAAIERMAGPAAAANDWTAAECFVWAPATHHLQPVARPNRIELSLITGVDHVRDILLDNTLRFAEGFTANNVLLWGARGMGKSSLVKSVHAQVARDTGVAVKLVEVHREDIATLPALMDILKTAPVPVIVFCDDLSFDHDDTSYKSLKAVLDGGVEGRPSNVLLYATSNRRHLLPRHMMENEQSTAINPSEAVEEKVSLSDRFGLWLGFHKCSQDDYLAMIDGYAAYYGFKLDRDTLHAEALEWATTRGARSGRVAWQFIQDLAGRLRHRIDG
ncbi:ATP-binding protein [Ensifer sp. ZNC0028]|uniref:ATP-binding protein n=1 Tax=Ensifer sp. ZNC0028 TaxID=1339236 RepID=UPI0005BA52E8|nr:ATP-binding protein [Ensifer sp. ZNC0028]